jgi:hypothetical protein
MIGNINTDGPTFRVFIPFHTEAPNPWTPGQPRRAVGQRAHAYPEPLDAWPAAARPHLRRRRTTARPGHAAAAGAQLHRLLRVAGVTPGVTWVQHRVAPRRVQSP